MRPRLHRFPLSGLRATLSLPINDLAHVGLIIDLDHTVSTLPDPRFDEIHILGNDHLISFIHCPQCVDPSCAINEAGCASYRFPTQTDFLMLNAPSFLMWCAMMMFASVDTHNSDMSDQKNLAAAGSVLMA